MTDILFGDANPGGKLPVTMYRSDYVNTVDMKSMNVTAYPGRSYRYFKGEPVFPFGWGLSYTSFSLKADDATATTAKSVSATMNTTISVLLAPSWVTRLCLPTSDRSRPMHQGQPRC